MLELAHAVLGDDIRFDHMVSLVKEGGHPGQAWHTHEYASGNVVRHRPESNSDVDQKASWRGADAGREGSATGHPPPTVTPDRPARENALFRLDTPRFRPHEARVCTRRCRTAAPTHRRTAAPPHRRSATPPLRRSAACLLRSASATSDAIPVLDAALFPRSRPDLGFIRIFFYVDGFNKGDGSLKVVRGSHHHRLHELLPGRTNLRFRALRDEWLPRYPTHPLTGEPSVVEDLECPPNSVVIMWTHALHAVAPRAVSSGTRHCVVTAFRNPGAPSQSRWISADFASRPSPGLPPRLKSLL